MRQRGDGGGARIEWSPRKANNCFWKRGGTTRIEGREAALLEKKEEPVHSLLRKPGGDIRQKEKENLRDEGEETFEGGMGWDGFSETAGSQPACHPWVPCSKLVEKEERGDKAKRQKREGRNEKEGGKGVHRKRGSVDRRSWSPRPRKTCIAWKLEVAPERGKKRDDP